MPATMGTMPTLATGTRIMIPRPANGVPDPELPQYAPEDVQTVLGRLGEKALSGLGYVGSVLDKTFGGRAIRGVLGGHFREGLSLLPFSDSLGITDPNDTVYGRDLLEKAGVLGENTPGFDMGDVLGFAADVALDPSTYINPFALTRHGLEASKLGVLPKGWGNQARGVDYLAEQVGHLKPVQEGLAGVQDLLPRGASVLPEDAAKLIAERAGSPLVPQFERIGTTAERAVPFTPAAGMPATAAVPAAVGPSQFHPGALGTAEEYLRQGRLPEAGDYLGNISRQGYDELKVHGSPAVGPPAVGQDALSGTRTALSDLPTGNATPLRGLIGIGLPFGEKTVFGTGPTAQKILDYVGGKAEALGQLAPVRYARTLFDPEVRGTTTAGGQKIASELASPLERTLQSGVYGDTFDLVRKIEPALKDVDPAELNRLLLMSAEGVPIPPDLAAYKADLLARSPATYAALDQAGKLEGVGAHLDTIRETGQQVRDLNAQYLAAEQAAGVPTYSLQDRNIDYVRRLLNPLPTEADQAKGLIAKVRGFFGRPVQPVGATHTSQIARKELFENFPEGTTQINELLRRTDVNGVPELLGEGRALSAPDAAAARIRENLTRTAGDITTGSASKTHLQDTLAQELTAAGTPLSRSEAAQRITALNQAGTPLSLQQQSALLSAGEHSEVRLAAAAKKQDAINKQAAQLATYLKKANTRFAEEGHDFFRQDPILATTLRGQQSAKARAGAESLIQGLPGIAKPMVADPGKTVAVKQLLKDAGLTHRDPTLHSRSFTTAEHLAAKALDVPIGQLKDFHVPAEVANDLTKWIKAYQQPEEIAPILKAFDSATSMTKAWLTAPFPAFHSRNIVSGLFNMWRDNALDTRSLADGKAVMTGHSIAPLPGMKPGTEAEVLDQTLRELYSKRVAFTTGVNRDVVKATPAGDVAQAMNVPGRTAETSLGQGVQDWAGRLKNEGSWNPLKGEDFKIVKAGREVGNASEDWMRISHYIAKRRQGFSPAEAAAAVEKYHFDYQNVTRFEKSVMKRFIPFYTFSRKNLPPLLEDLATRPAKLAGTIRGATVGRTEDTFVPPYISEGTNVPLPGAPEGYARYVSSFGLPFEDEFFKGLGALAGGDTKRFFGNVLGGMNPIMKLPVEQASGVQLHTGRQLSDLRPTGVANVLALGNEDVARPLTRVLGATPASRFISSIDNLADLDVLGGRKSALGVGTNMLTGARLTDVDLAKQQEIAARETLKNILKDRPNVRSFEDVYVKPENLSSLSPEELAFYSLYKQMQREAQQRALQNKRIGVLQPAP